MLTSNTIESCNHNPDDITKGPSKHKSFQDMENCQVLVIWKIGIPGNMISKSSSKQLTCMSFSQLLEYSDGFLGSLTTGRIFFFDLLFPSDFFFLVLSDVLICLSFFLFSNCDLLLVGDPTLCFFGLGSWSLLCVETGAFRLCFISITQLLTRKPREE